MNTLVIVVIAACCLAAGYLLYGRWLAHKWGIDPNAKTPAVTKEDGQDYVPTDGWVVFAHQFSSIAGAGPVTGAIQAANCRKCKKSRCSGKCKPDHVLSFRRLYFLDKHNYKHCQSRNRISQKAYCKR